MVEPSVVEDMLKLNKVNKLYFDVLLDFQNKGTVVFKMLVPKLFDVVFVSPYGNVGTVPNAKFISDPGTVTGSSLGGICSTNLLSVNCPPCDSCQRLFI